MGNIITPGIPFPRKPPASGFFPLSLRGQALPIELRVSRSTIPAYRNNRMIFTASLWPVSISHPLDQAIFAIDTQKQMPIRISVFPIFSRSKGHHFREVDFCLNPNYLFDCLPEELKHSSEGKQRLKELASSLPGSGHVCPYDKHPQVHQ